jgi:hypothetical protein
MIRIDGYLSRMVQEGLPYATVRVDEEGDLQTWFVQKNEDKVLGLGSSFKEARSAVDVLVKAVKARRAVGVAEESILSWSSRS